jgi:ammonia channel protein AmtB
MAKEKEKKSRSVGCLAFGWVGMNSGSQGKGRKQSWQ